MVFAGMEHDGDRRACSDGADYLDMSVVQVHQLFGQIQSDTGTGSVETVDLVIAAETLKQHTALLRWNTDTFILYGERDKARLGVHNDADCFAGGRELEGVAQQVPQHRIHTSAVDPYGRVFGSVLHCERDMFVVRLFAEIRAGLVHQLNQRRRLHLEFHLLVLYLAEF